MAYQLNYKNSSLLVYINVKNPKKLKKIVKLPKKLKKFVKLPKKL